MKRSGIAILTAALAMCSIFTATTAMADNVLYALSKKIPFLHAGHLSLILSLLLMVAMIICFAIGGWVGRRKERAATGTDEHGRGLIEAALFALLGLLLAFQFSGAMSRLDTRRQIIVEEANAIGTAYLRLDLITGEMRTELKQLFRDYTDARIRIWDLLPDMKAAKTELTRSKVLQQEIWSRAVEASKKEPTTAAAILLVPALNNMIDITTTRTVAVLTHVPTLIVVLLFGATLLGTLLAGYALSEGTKSNLLHMAIFILMISLTVYTIIDLEFPRAGLIRIGAADKAMIELRQSME